LILAGFDPSRGNSCQPWIQHIFSELLHRWSGYEMALNIEVIIKDGEGWEKLLRRFRGFKALLFSLSSSRRLVWVFGSIVQALSNQVNRTRQYIFNSGYWCRPFIRHDNVGRDLLAFHGATQKPGSGRFVSSRLKQDIQHFSFVIDGSPEKELLAADLQKHLVDVPGWTWFWPDIP
jgi:hypothetical protein